MGQNGFIVAFSIFILVSNTRCALFDSQLRKLIANESHNAPANLSVTPTGSPTDLRNNTKNSDKPEEAKPKESPKDDHHDNKTSPIDPKNANQNLTDGNPSTEKSGVGKVDRGNQNVPNDDDSCEGSLANCTIPDHEIFACVKASKNGSGKLFVVVHNKEKSTANVDVNLPNYSKNPLLQFPVDGQNTTKKDMPSSVGNNTKLLYVKYGKVECQLDLAPNPMFVDNLMRQLSSYLTPIYVVYGSILLVLLFGGTFACCKLRKRNRENGIPYQELEMGFPESAAASAVNVDAVEGWDHDWDDDDWDEDTAVKSPAGHQVRNVSADGLTSRSPKKNGWDDNWED